MGWGSDSYTSGRKNKKSLRKSRRLGRKSARKYKTRKKRGAKKSRNRKSSYSYKPKRVAKGRKKGRQKGLGPSTVRGGKKPKS